MDYLVTISPQGVRIFYETYNMKHIQLIQPMNIMDDSEPYYMVVITYTDGSKEQTLIPHHQWEMWNKWQTERKVNEDK